MDQYHLNYLVFPVLLLVPEGPVDLYLLVFPDHLEDPYHLVFQSALTHPVFLVGLYHLKCLVDQYIPLDLIHLRDPVHPLVPDRPLGLADPPHLLHLEDLVRLEGLEVLVTLLDPVLLEVPLGTGDLLHIRYDYKFPFVIVRVHSSPFYLLTGYQYLTFGSFHVGYELSAFVP